MCLFVAIGWIRPNKGLESIIDAFEKLKRDDAVLVIAGQAGDEAYFSKLKAQAEGNDSFVFIGRNLESGEVAWLHRNATAVLFCFTRCHTSASVLTALSLGSSILAPSIGHAKELLRDGAGLLFDPENPVEGISERILQLISDPDLSSQLRACARARAASQSWDEITGILMKIYTS